MEDGREEKHFSSGRRCVKARSVELSIIRMAARDFLRVRVVQQTTTRDGKSESGDREHVVEVVAEH